ncbi:MULTISPECIES: DUF4159 domain-containing protein [unclassified Aureimonas]|uniref:DUF4159 domain-containing protein n=1 Tax=unclassified Aureimonas TaxID=2615206 RepID=UPI0006F592CE|nr:MULTISPECIES: DUF4159 domain-containing protein [unclassified Aureimonas]KQT66114.1 RNA-binding protein [Aureimonas sp. Leaf427]KQT81022.1 RNA-binding protein [Aureimonas sp. Leaf460]
MGFLGLSFGAPLVLAGLLSLPLIWWLLKLTPPRPQTEAFPPLRILAEVKRTEETPAKSPWWLTLLRLLLAALVIFALAAPVLNPSEGRLSGSGPVAILLDNGWASSGGPGGEAFDLRREAAADLVREAGEAGRPVALALSAEGASDDATPIEASVALERLGAAEPHPIPTDRASAAARLATALGGTAPGSLAVLSDGLDSAGSAEALASLGALGASQALLYRPAIDRLVGLTGADNSTEALVVDGVRPAGASEARPVPLRALDAQGREVGRAVLPFAAGETKASARFEIPVELRNDIARIEVEGAADAGAVRLVDDSFRRRRVGLVSGEAADAAQPLLSPLYYITRALEPFADLARAESADLATAVPALIERRPSVVVLADIGVMPEPAEAALRRFVETGGVLVRFAGPRLAATTGEDPLVPVRLRSGERQLGGSLSWSEPQRIAPIPVTSPLAGIGIGEDVTVSRQILAEPSADLASKTWVSLLDGTPLVTAETVGAGTIVLFHVTAEATWSNLPISGAFVDMLRRIVTLSRAGGPAATAATGTAAPAAADPAAQAAPQVATESLPPYRVLDAAGRLGTPGPQVEPLVVGAAAPAPSLKNPPGLYGSEEGYSALNLLGPDAALAPLGPDALGVSAAELGYGREGTVDLTPWLFAGALLLFLLDALAMLWLNGAARTLSRLRPRGQAVLPVLALLALGGLLISSGGAVAQDAAAEKARAEAAIAATETTHLAYVETGDSQTDEVSRRGLDGLSQFIAAKTALEPGAAVGVDIASDELAFYPILYWAIDASAPMPAASAISRVDGYMKQGGTVLFDVKDDELSSLDDTSVSPGQRRLRDILADLDIPPLEPVPSDHVLTKSFYIMKDFPGRHTGSDLWVEALVRDPNAASRPANAGDGVSSIMITSNDFAGAWAVDEGGLFLYPTESSDPSQREYAYRAGVNIVMYVLTGNYKADQVHVPALLERLGQ